MKYRIQTIKFRKFISSNQKAKSFQNTHLKLKIMQSRKTNLSELYLVKCLSDPILEKQKNGA